MPPISSLFASILRFPSDRTVLHTHKRPLCPILQLNNILQYQYYVQPKIERYYNVHRLPQINIFCHSILMIVIATFIILGTFGNVFKLYNFFQSFWQSVQFCYRKFPIRSTKHFTCSFFIDKKHYTARGNGRLWRFI